MKIFNFLFPFLFKSSILRSFPIWKEMVHIWQWKWTNLRKKCPQIFKFHLCAQCLQAFAIANPIPKFPKRFESHPHYYTLFVLPPQINSSFSHNSTHFQNNIKIQMDFGQLQMQFSTFRFLWFTKSLNSYPHCAKFQMILEV